jgi:uncharacterized protein
MRQKWVEPSVEVKICRDPKDDRFLSLALSGNANCLVTGDEDLLVPHPFHGIAIITPQQFLATFASTNTGGAARDE